MFVIGVFFSVISALQVLRVTIETASKPRTKKRGFLDQKAPHIFYNPLSKKQTGNHKDFASDPILTTIMSITSSTTVAPPTPNIQFNSTSATPSQQLEASTIPPPTVLLQNLTKERSSSCFEQIDVVYTWVNGTDPRQMENLRRMKKLLLGEDCMLMKKKKKYLRYFFFLRKWSRDKQTLFLNKKKSDEIRLPCPKNGTATQNCVKDEETASRFIGKKKKNYAGTKKRKRKTKNGKKKSRNR